ncbi:amidase [Roseovarius sp. SCSIO 43702]|uniref:amidase n=1 Tax=Roseovarius sp. SCSIO 43702 TaxID=2823043 RepID=UPI001C737831|nr:amidase [Roseovarius sp. SCSIO 43702]QYX56005.1 amidase [Roseovarius sp. SCSIO 43702]
MMLQRPDQTEADDLCYLSAVRALEMFRSRDLSPVELLRAQIARAEKVEPEINAFTETFFDTAMTEARAAEARYMSRSADPRPLEGLTVTIKDVLDQKGACTSRGSLVFKGHRADTDHPVVERVRQAGGIIHARTTTSEFAFGWVTATRLWGVTRNPWNPERTPGGSSGGAAASLAAGTSTLAIGADSAGSIRVPAALCGVVGYKPPHGRVPDPVEGFDPYSVIGPMARSVADCALLQNVISGVHPADITSLRERVTLKAREPAPGGLRLAASFDPGKTMPEAGIVAAIRGVIAKLQAHGAEIEEPEIDWPEGVGDLALRHSACLSAPWFGDMMDRHGDELCDYTRWTAELMKSCSLRDLTDSYDMARQLYRAVEPVLARYDALICPVVLTNRVRADQMPWTEMRVNGVCLNSDYDWVTTAHFNMLGELPSLSVPVGFDADGMPVGVQVVARSFDDARAFRVAAAIEHVAGAGCGLRAPG